MNIASKLKPFTLKSGFFLMTCSTETPGCVENHEKEKTWQFDAGCSSSHDPKGNLCLWLKINQPLDSSLTE